MKKLMMTAIALATASVFAGGDMATGNAPEPDVNKDVNFGVGTWTLSADYTISGNRYICWRGSGANAEGNKTILDMRDGNHTLTLVEDTNNPWRQKAFAYNNYLNFQVLGGSMVFSGCDFMFGNYNDGTPEHNLTALVDGTSMTMRNMYLVERMTDSGITFNNVTAGVSGDFYFNHMTGAKQVGSTRNTAVFSGGSTLTVGGTFWGGICETDPIPAADVFSEAYDNKLIFTGSGTTVNANGQLLWGREIKGSELIISDGAVFNANSTTKESRIGQKANYGGDSKITVDGGTFVGKNHFHLGAVNGSDGHRIEVKNGGTFRIENEANNATIYAGIGAAADCGIVVSNATLDARALQIGGNAEANGTYLTLTGPTATLDLHGAKPTFRGKNGVFTVENGATYSFSGDIYTGWNSMQTDGNKIVVRDGGTFSGGTVILSSGNAGDNNELIVDNANLSVPQLYLANADKVDTHGHKITLKGAGSNIALANAQPFRFFGTDCTVELDGVTLFSDYTKALRTFEENATRLKNGGKFIIRNGAVVKANYFQHGVNAFRPVGGGVEIYDSTLDASGGGVGQISSTSTNSVFVFSGATVKAKAGIRFGQGGNGHTVTISGDTQLESETDVAFIYNSAVTIAVPAGGFTRPVLKCATGAGFDTCTFTFTGVDSLASDAVEPYDIPLIEAGTKPVSFSAGSVDAINAMLPGGCRLKLTDDSKKAWLHIEPLTVANPEAKVFRGADETGVGFATLEGALEYAEDGDTVRIVDRSTTAGAFEPDATIVLDKDITVKLDDGLEIVYPEGVPLFTISGDVTIVGGGDEFCIYEPVTFAQITGGGSLSVSGVSFAYDGEDSAGAVFDVVNGSLEITGGGFSANPLDNYRAVACAANGTARIKGGLFEGFGFSGAVMIPGLVGGVANTVMFDYDASDFCEAGYVTELDEDSGFYTVVEFSIPEDGLTYETAFRSIAKYNAAVATTDFDGVDIYLVLDGVTFTEGTNYSLDRQYEGSEPATAQPRPHLYFLNCAFEGGSQGKMSPDQGSTGPVGGPGSNRKEIALCCVKELMVSNCTFAAYNGDSYVIDLNVFNWFANEGCGYTIVDNTFAAGAGNRCPISVKNKKATPPAFVIIEGNTFLGDGNSEGKYGVAAGMTPVICFGDQSGSTTTAGGANFPITIQNNTYADGDYAVLSGTFVSSGKELVTVDDEAAFNWAYDSGKAAWTSSPVKLPGDPNAAVVAEEATVGTVGFDADGKFVISFTGTEGATYVLKKATLLTAPVEWTTVKEYTATGSAQETDAMTTEGDAGFYKLEIK